MLCKHTMELNNSNNSMCFTQEEFIRGDNKYYTVYQKLLSITHFNLLFYIINSLSAVHKP